MMHPSLKYEYSHLQLHWEDHAKPGKVDTTSTPTVPAHAEKLLQPNKNIIAY